MDFEKYNDKFLREYLKFNKHKRVVQRRAKPHPTNYDLSVCPHCGAKTKSDYEHAETYCTSCGLITSATIPYVGNHKVYYPYGLLL